MKNSTTKNYYTYNVDFSHTKNEYLVVYSFGIFFYKNISNSTP